MEQINFRVSKDEKQVIDIIARAKGISTSELAKQTILKDVKSTRIDLAFELLRQGKIGRKKAWIISGLSSHEFLVEWTRRGAEEVMPEDIVDRELEIAKDVDLKRFLR
ncbi:MAG: hypothetical protein GYA24_11480 [Candidatus Lokiarchaeota archaeon]|nr:hypothetical protein [Candidatus Lokiarchaeota archaeon]